jgi:protein TonB
MMDRLTLTRLMPVAASLLFHAGIAGAIALGPGRDAVRPPVLLAVLIEPEARPAPPPPPPRPIVPDRRPLIPPKPIETPLPSEPPPTPPRAEPEPPPPTAPEPVAAPAPAPPAPAPSVATPVTPAAPPASVISGPVAVATPDSARGVFVGPLPVPGTPAVAAPGPASSGPPVAALPSDGITQRALPRGGYQYRPPYPASARNRGIQGTTLLEVLVTADGRVTEVVVKESAGHPDLDQAAADAVRRWRFEPARRGSEPVAMRVELPFEFRLRR